MYILYITPSMNIFFIKVAPNKILGIHPCVEAYTRGKSPVKEKGLVN